MATPPKIPGMGVFVDKNPGESRPATPAQVVAAARLMVVAAVVQLFASIVAIVYAASPDRLTAIQAQVDAMSGNVPSVESVRNMGVITVVVAGLATVCAYLLFAFVMHRGRSWARVATGVLVALTLVQLVGISFPVGWTTVAQLCLGAVAVGLCYMPQSNNYFATIKGAGK